MATKIVDGIAANRVPAVNVQTPTKFRSSFRRRLSFSKDVLSDGRPAGDEGQVLEIRSEIRFGVSRRRVADSACQFPLVLLSLRSSL